MSANSMSSHDLRAETVPALVAVILIVLMLSLSLGLDLGSTATQTHYEPAAEAGTD